METQLQPHQQRVVREKTELDEKIQRLTLFKGGEIWKTLPLDEQTRMNRQLTAMQQYSQALSDRIAAF